MTTKDSYLSHIKHDQAHMVDVSHKLATERFAQAQAYVHIPASLGEHLADCSWVSSKGPVFHTAIIAGTMAAKNTANLIPMCHTLSISSVEIGINLVNNRLIKILAGVKTRGQTGVEMEALSAASVAALTIYDMCKSYSSNLVIGDIRLVQKTGGKRDYSWTGARGRAKLANERGQSSSSSE
jgi:cyclic pyranopterin phosphate synthase